MLLDTVKNLKDIIKQYKLLFTIFFTGVTITAVGLLYLFKYNNLLFVDGSNHLTLENKSYSFSGNLEGETLEILLKRMEREFSDEERIGILLFTDEKVELEEYHALGSICGSYGNADEKLCGLICGELIKKGEEDKALLKDSFFISHNMGEKKTGDNLKVQEENLEIAGVGFWDIFCDDGSIPDLILTYQAFLKVCNQISRVDLILERPLKRAEYKRLDRLLSEGITYKKPPIADFNLGKEYLSRFLTNGILIILAMSSLLGLYQYILMERRREFAIYRILGMTNRQLFQRIAIELNLLFFMNCVLGTIVILGIQKIWENTLFSGMKLYDYIIGYVMILLCGWIASIPLLRKMKKKEVFQQYITGEEA